MNTIFKRKFFAIVSLFAMFFVASSCVDNEGIEVTAEAPNADKTLYEVIVNDAQLADFVEVLNACNLPSSNVGVADSLFNTSRVYTVWAPVNGAFKKDSILQRIKDGYRDEVMSTFIGSHVANFLRPAKGTFEGEGELVLMLNEKKLLFAGSYKDGYTFAGNKLCENAVNNRVKNGIIHKIETMTKYEYNIWEYLKVYAANQQNSYKVDSVVNYLYSYNDTIFNEYLSIPGPIVNGAETYLDSIFTFENDLLTKFGGVGSLNDEDSTYTFYLPTNNAWTKMKAQAEKHFNYVLTSTVTDDTILVDSLRRYHPNFNLIKYLTYSDNEQKYVESQDSIIPIQYEHPSKLFARSVIDREVVDTKELSNGRINIVDEYPYTIFDLWHDTIRIEAEATSYICLNKTTNKDFVNKYTVYEKEINKEAGEELSGSQYIEYCDGENGQITLGYYIPNVKSATYQIALITVPDNIRKNNKVNTEEQLPIKLLCNVFSYDPIKKAPNESLLDLAEDELGETLEPKLDRIDTLFLSKPVTFPICEYNFVTDVKKYETQIMISSENHKKRFDNTIRLDAILLIPVEDAE